MVPHYISADDNFLSMLSASSTVSSLDQGGQLFSDRGAGRFGEVIVSPNAKSALWFTSDGDLQVWKVKNEADFIVNDAAATIGNFSSVLTSPDKRFLVYSLFEKVPQAKADLLVNGGQGTFSVLTVYGDRMELNTNTGKKAKIAEWGSGSELTKVEVTDAGNFQAVRGGKILWSVLPPAGQQPATGGTMAGFNLQSLLLPGLAVAAFLFLRK